MPESFIGMLPETNDDDELALRRHLDSHDPQVRAEAALRLGATYRNLEPATARRLLAVALRGTPLTKARALLRLSYVSTQEGDSRQARDYLATANAISGDLLDESPADADLIALRVDIATAFALLLQVQEAVVLLANLDRHVHDLRDQDPGTDDLWRELAAAINLRLGDILTESDPRLASEALRKAMALGSGSIEATAALHRGWLLEHRLAGLTPDTEEHYRRATELDDPVVAPAAHVSLGDALWRSGRPDLARRQWERAAEDAGSDIAEEVSDRLRGLWPCHSARQPLSAADTSRRTRPLPLRPTTAVGRIAAGRAADDDGPNGKRVIVVGAGTGGHYLLPGLRNTYEVIAFVDDNPNVETVDGVPIVGTIDDLERVIANHKRVDQIILAIPTASGATRNRVLRAAHRCGVNLVTLPSMFELRLGHPMVPQLRPLEVSETFGDFTWHVDRRAAGFVRGHRVAITGAGSDIGKALALRVAHGHARQLLLLDELPRPLMKLAAELRNHRDFADADVRILDLADLDEVTDTFAEFRPEAVFHCAGLNHAPPPAVMRPSHAARANVLAARVVATAAAKTGARDFLLASTDRAAHRSKPFDWTKALAEAAVLKLAKPETDRRGGLYAANGMHAGFRVAVLRLPNVWARDSAIVGRLIDQLSEGGPIQADPLVRRKFIPAWEAAEALLRLFGSAHDGGLFAYMRGEVLDINTIAERLIMVHGLMANRDIQIDRKPRGDTKSGVHLVGVGESASENETDGVIEIEQSQSLVAEIHARLAVLNSVFDGANATGRERALGDELLSEVAKQAIR
jgi:FlaA1/EpsC-like NDP-sugar epimerase/tetratricopeptide (TPR) repeat protein